MDALRAIVGDEHLREDVAVGDATGATGRAAALVAPADASQVAEVVAWCYAHDVAIVPRGGGTGLAGGAVPGAAETVVLALDRLAAIRSLDPGLWRMEAEAGVTTATVARRARESGLLFPPDPGAAEQSQLGGTIATNAGGPHAFKYGVTGDWVTGVEAVLAPGELVTLGGPVRKDVAGYDLRGLLCGSEGTLGIVTAAWLRLVPAPEAAHVAVLVAADAQAGQAALERVLACGAVPAAIEFLDAGTLHAAPPPWEGEPGFALLVEVDGTTAEAAASRDAVLEALGDGPGRVHVPEDLRTLWRWRGGVLHGVTAQRGAKLSEDVAVPLDRLADAADETLAIGARHGVPACAWGHAGDGNLHSSFLFDPDDAGERASAQAAAHELLGMAARLGGTITGEHGIGTAKNGHLRAQWAPAAVAAHEAVKRALDPKGLLNPGKKLA